MADLRKHSSTSNLIRVVLKHATTGAPLTGLTEASAGLIIGTIVDNEATTTRYRASSSEIETITALGTFAAPTSGKVRFKEVDATNHPGVYEIQVADARFSVASAKRMIVSWSGASNLLAGDYEIQLTQFDAYDAVRLGLSALPAVAAEGLGGLFTRGTGAGQINQAANGMIDTNPVRLNNVSQSLLDLKDFVDDGYDPSTNKVQGVVLVDTATTLTNAPSDSAGVTTLLSRLSALRAGYLDNLSAGAVATAAKLLAYFQSALRSDVTVDPDIGGSYDDGTDSQQAIRDRGDAAWTTAAGFSTHSAADVWAVGTRELTGFSASFKTGYALSSAGVQAIWDALTSALSTANSIGKLVVDNVNATISSRSSHSAADVWAAGTRTLTGFGSLVADIWAAVVDSPGVTTLLARLTSGRAGNLDNLDAAITTRGSQASLDLVKGVTDKVDDTLEDDGGTFRFTTNALEQAPAGGGGGTTDWTSDERTAIRSILGIPGSGTTPADPSAGILDTTRDLVVLVKAKTDLIPASPAATGDIPTAVQNRQEMDSNSTRLAAIDVKTTNLPSDPADQSLIIAATNAITAAIAGLNDVDAADIRAAIGLASANLDTQLDALPTTAELTAALASADDAVLTAINALANLTAAQVRTQMIAALSSDTYAEPGSVPPATASIADKVGFMCALARNRQTLNKDTGLATLRNGSDTGNIGTRTDSDDNVTYEKGAFA
jgi:hypothetical protein